MSSTPLATERSIKSSHLSLGDCFTPLNPGSQAKQDHISGFPFDASTLLGIDTEPFGLEFLDSTRNPEFIEGLTAERLCGRVKFAEEGGPVEPQILSSVAGGLPHDCLNALWHSPYGTRLFG